MFHIVCLVNVEADRASFTWSEGPALFEPYQLEGGLFADFMELAAEAREKLSDVVKDCLHDEQNLPQSTFALAEAGHELYLQIFDPGAEQARGAREVRQWLESLRLSRTIDTLEMVVDCPWSMPWNVVYDQPPDRAAFQAADPENHDHWRPFWAIRYNLAGGRRVSPLRRLPLLEKPRVLFVVDPQIRDGLPEEQQQELREFVEQQQFAIAESKDQLAAAIKAQRPDLLYWLSHATPSALVLNEEEISPRQLRRLLRRDDADSPFEFGGIAFLNACQTAESGETGSFFDALHSVGFSGMIGTEHQTIDTFACPLGLEFLRQFLVQQEPLGEVMRRLRARVPLGLLYGTYCPPGLRVGRPEGPEASVEIVSSKLAVGVALGGAVDAVPQLLTLPDEPYRSLGYYSYEDRALFAGREDDVERFAGLLDDGDIRLIVLHGESGVGKSSFLRAGVIPYLEDECIGYRFVREQLGDHSGQAALFARATNDLAGSLAQLITHFCASPFVYATPLEQSVELDLPQLLREVAGGRDGSAAAVDPAALRDAMLDDPALLARILGEISQRLPFAPVLVIDQAEEIFTLANSEQDSDNRALAIAMLRRVVAGSGRYKVILSLRTEYYGRLVDGLRKGAAESEGIREYLLTDFDESALHRAIVRPTSEEISGGLQESPRAKYRFEYAEGVAEDIARRVSRYSIQRNDSVLPLMQVICSQLYDRARRAGSAAITSDDVEGIGGMEGGMRSHVETIIKSMFPDSPSEARCLRQLMAQLYVRQVDGSLTTALLREDEALSRWTGEQPFAEVVALAQRQRLLRVNALRIGGDEEARYVSLGHDALAKLAAEWDEEFGRAERLQKMALALVAVSSVAAVLLALAVFASSQWSRAEKNRQIANDNRKAAEANLRKAVESVDTYYKTVSEETLLHRPGMQPLREELLARAIDDYDWVLRERGRDEVSGKPQVRRKLSETYYSAGRNAIDLGQPEKAIDWLNKARALQEKLAEQDFPEKKLALSNTWIELGNARFRMEEARNKEEQDWTLPLQDYQRAAELRKELWDANPADAEIVRRYADVLMNVGQCQWLAGKTDAGREKINQGQELRLGLLEGEDTDTPDLRSELGKSYYNLGRLQFKAAENEADFEIAKLQFNDAKTELENAKAQLALVVDSRPGDSESSSIIGYCDRYLGQMKAYLDYSLTSTVEPLTAAIDYFNAAFDRLDDLAERNPAVTEFRLQAAYAAFELGDSYRMLAEREDRGEEGETDRKSARDAFQKAKRGFDMLAADKSDAEEGSADRAAASEAIEMSEKAQAQIDVLG